MIILFTAIIAYVIDGLGTRLFQNNNSTYGGAVRINESKGDFSITNSTFQYNNAFGGGAMLLDGLIGDLLSIIAHFRLIVVLIAVVL